MGVWLGQRWVLVLFFFFFFLFSGFGKLRQWRLGFRKCWKFGEIGFFEFVVEVKLGGDNEDWLGNGFGGSLMGWKWVRIWNGLVTR